MVHVFHSVQILSLAIIVGGGIVLGGGVRSQFLITMKHTKDVHEMETLHIKVWNAYNRMSLMAVVVMLVSQAILVTVFNQFHIFSITLTIGLILLFLLKLFIDSKLKNRALENIDVIELIEQKSDHKTVEFLSIVILGISTIGLFFIT